MSSFSNLVANTRAQPDRAIGFIALVLAFATSTAFLWSQVSMPVNFSYSVAMAFAAERLVIGLAAFHRRK
jgi:hypothetical protein